MRHHYRAERKRESKSINRPPERILKIRACLFRGPRQGIAIEALAGNPLDGGIGVSRAVAKTGSAAIGRVERMNRLASSQVTTFLGVERDEV